MQEFWQPVPGAVAYEVSSLGRVRRLAGTYGCRSGRVLHCRIDKHGYVACALSLGKAGVYRHAQVHRLVAEAFLGAAPDADSEVAHFDGDRTNNRLANLRWATPKENAADRTRHGRSVGAHKGEGHHNARLNEGDVVEMRRLKAAGLRLEEIAEEFGVGRITVYDAVKGRTWGHVHDGL